MQLEHSPFGRTQSTTQSNHDTHNNKIHLPPFWAYSQRSYRNWETQGTAWEWRIPVNLQHRLLPDLSKDLASKRSLGVIVSLSAPRNSLTAAITPTHNPIMTRTKTKYIYIPLFATASELIEAEKRKTRLENEGYKLIHSTACNLTYQKTWHPNDHLMPARLLALLETL